MKQETDAECPALLPGNWRDSPYQLGRYTCPGLCPALVRASACHQKKYNCCHQQLDGRKDHSRTSRSRRAWAARSRSEEHTSELQSLMRSSYAVFCLKKKNRPTL